MSEIKETKLCKHCRSEIDKKAKVCPVCRKKQGLGFFKIVGIAFLSLVVLVIVGAALGGGGNETEKTPSGEVVVKDDLTVEGNITESKDTYSMYLEGIVKNNTDDEMTLVSISFNLYDKDGNLLGTAIDSITSLKAGGTWKFKAMSLLTSDQLKEVTKWELEEVSGF